MTKGDQSGEQLLNVSHVPSAEVSFICSDISTVALSHGNEVAGGSRQQSMSPNSQRA